MNRLTLTLIAAAILVPVALAGGAAKLVNVTTPMTRDLDGGQHAILNVSGINANSIQAIGPAPQFNLGIMLAGTYYVAGNGLSAPSVLSGLTDPSVSCPAANPASLYLRQVTQPPTTGELWAKVAQPCGWTRITP